MNSGKQGGQVHQRLWLLRIPSAPRAAMSLRADELSRLCERIEDNDPALGEIVGRDDARVAEADDGGAC